MLSYEALASWAGADHVTRAAPDTVAGWRLPEQQKSLLIKVGVPIIDDLIENAAFSPSPTQRFRPRPDACSTA